MNTTVKLMDPRSDIFFVSHEAIYPKKVRSKCYRRFVDDNVVPFEKLENLQQFSAYMNKQFPNSGFL